MRAIWANEVILVRISVVHATHRAGWNSSCCHGDSLALLGSSLKKTDCISDLRENSSHEYIDCQTVLLGGCVA